MMMRSPNLVESRTSLRERVLDLAWSLWAELGVPGWARRHQDWAIDPEPLILFTVLLGPSDPRLRDEAIRWCARNSRFVSIARLRNLLKATSSALRELWGPFAATVNALGEADWPGSTEPLGVRPSSKESVDDFRRPALIALRLRSAFGVSARSEILLTLIGRPTARVIAADLADVTHYSKRNVEKELEALRKAGMLAVERKGNRLEHAVAESESLLLFAAPRPNRYPRWDEIFAVLGALLDYEERVVSLDPTVAAIEARRVLQDISRAAQKANLPAPPNATSGHVFTSSVLAWASSLANALARGDTDALGWVTAEADAMPDWRAHRLEGTRGIASPLLATATDLSVWADTRVAQGRMPELLRSLILATAPDLERIEMASGEGVQSGGYDGVVVNASMTPFVPAGQSVWEIGVGRDVKRKADDDFAKRSTASRGIDPSATTFVFVTPRRWAAKRLWESQKKHEAVWREVRVLDADDLEAWLAVAPAVHSWLSALLGKSWPSVQDLRSFWQDWQQATRPALSADVVLAGRIEIASELRTRLQGQTTVLRVQGESADEALAFIAATIEGMDQADALFARSLVVSDAAGWSWAVSQGNSLLLISRFADPNAASAIRQDHRVLVPVGREGAEPDDLVIPPLHREQLRSALVAKGVAALEANVLAARGRASLTALRRSLAIDRGLARPAWAHRTEAPSLLPALLASAWDESKPADQEVISYIADRPYQDVERVLARWVLDADSPVRKVGTTWFLTSKEDAWFLLSEQLTRSDLDRFRDALLPALGIPDPALELPVDQRWMANVLGREHPLSAQLREGLVDTLAIMGARSGDRTFLTGHTGQWHASVITRDLLARANADMSGTLWASLTHVLPLLAEAAPEAFLDAVDLALARDPSPLLALFTDDNSRAVFFASSPHTGLLWALETLAWSMDYVGAVSRQLAVLSRLDPDGKQSNRPIRSLRSIFLTWDPQTTASLTTRLSALDSVRKCEPEIAWHLMLSILPRVHDISTPTAVPRWRHWRDTKAERVSPDELTQAVQEVITRLLGDAGLSGDYWSDLIRALPDLRSMAVVEELERLAPSAFTPQDRMKVWDTLRSEISNHRSFSDAAWALPSQIVDRLDQVYQSFAPDDDVQRVAWLFAQNPPLPLGEAEDWTEHREAIQRAQAAAIVTIRGCGGLASLERLAHVAERPDIVGYFVGKTAVIGASAEDAALLDGLDASDQSDRSFAHGYAAGRFEAEGWDWVENVLGSVAPDWSVEQRAAFLTALPFGRETWVRVERFGEDTEQRYWSTVQPYRIPDPAALNYAAERLLRYGRAANAVDLLAVLRNAAAAGVRPHLAMEALEQVLQNGLPEQWSGLAHDITELLDHLAASKDADVPRVARLEWGFLPLLRGVGRSTGVLGRELARSPTFFVEILSLVFRARDEEPNDATAVDQARALLGYQLLDSWHQPPGYSDDGTLDEAVLNTWVDAARGLAAARKREAIGDQQIGRILSYLPPGPDDLWPHPMVRGLIERLASRDLETGLEIGLHNRRGFTWRDVSEGGAQERLLEMQYLDFAQQANANWPRTAAMLRRIARSYAEEARQHDEEAELTADGLH